MSLTLSDWLYDGILRDGGVLAIDPLYFQITGGRERWLYRVARKHAGGAGGEGFAISLQTLYEKSGAEGTYRRFKFEISKLARENGLPGFSLLLDAERAGEPLLRMTRREMVGTEHWTAATGANTPRRASRKSIPLDAQLRLERPSFVPDAMLARIRDDFPGWDLSVLRQEFDSYLSGDIARKPDNYASAFYGFVKQHHAKNRHTLR